MVPMMLFRRMNIKAGFKVEEFNNMCPPNTEAIEVS